MTTKPLALLTRPLADATVTQQQLFDLGIESFIEPMITITPLPHAEQEITTLIEGGATTLIITSHNAVRAIASSIPNNFPIIAVGSKTTQKISSHGFSNVKDAGGDVENLIKFIKENYSTENEHFLYAASDFTSTNLVWELTKLGFAAKEVIAYNAKPAQKLSQDCIKLLQERRFNLIPLYSKRSCQILTSLLEIERLNSNISNTDIFCLSANVAEPLKAIGHNKIHISNAPNSESLLELIRNFGFTTI